MAQLLIDLLVSFCRINPLDGRNSQGKKKEYFFVFVSFYFNLFF